LKMFTRFQMFLSQGQLLQNLKFLALAMNISRARTSTVMHVKYMIAIFL
jgi:hypothetical protein